MRPTQKYLTANTYLLPFTFRGQQEAPCVHCTTLPLALSILWYVYPKPYLSTCPSSSSSNPALDAFRRHYIPCISHMWRRLFLPSLQCLEKEWVFSLALVLGHSLPLFPKICESHVVTMHHTQLLMATVLCLCLFSFSLPETLGLHPLPLKNLACLSPFSLTMGPGPCFVLYQENGTTQNSLTLFHIYLAHRSTYLPSRELSGWSLQAHVKGQGLQRALDATCFHLLKGMALAIFSYVICISHLLHFTESFLSIHLYYDFSDVKFF